MTSTAGVGRHEIDQQLHAVHQGRRECLHAVDRHVPERSCPSISISSGCCSASAAASGSYLVGQQQLPTRRRRDLGQRADPSIAGRRQRNTRILLDRCRRRSRSRTGCSSVGGKTSTIPPRTANSPRRSTRSTCRTPRRPAAAARSVEVDLRANREAYRRTRSAESLHLGLKDAAYRCDDDPRRRAA